MLTERHLAAALILLSMIGAGLLTAVIVLELQ